jgi:3-hydroxyisobutyrate dehydrogenase-like beta-hydroxyacid dehydrogenase
MSGGQKRCWLKRGIEVKTLQATKYELGGTLLENIEEQEVLRIGFLGFGEVGYTFAKGLQSNPACIVAAYDNNQDSSWKGDLIQKRAAESGVTLVNGPAELTNCSDIILGMVPAKFTLVAAKSVIPFLTTSKVYCDLGSATPSTKRQIIESEAAKGVHFLDGAIMGSMPLYEFKAPILVAGESADYWAGRLRHVGFNVKSAGYEVGAASTIKLLRSVFTKGYEALILETFHAASFLEIEDMVRDVLADTFDNETFSQSVDRYITSDAIHADRRAHEVKGVEQVLRELGVEPIMAKATRRRLEWSASLGLCDRFHGMQPSDPKIVLKVIREAVKSKS